MYWSCMHQSHVYASVPRRVQTSHASRDGLVARLHGAGSSPSVSCHRCQLQASMRGRPGVAFHTLRASASSSRPRHVADAPRNCLVSARQAQCAGALPASSRRRRTADVSRRRHVAGVLFVRNTQSASCPLAPRVCCKEAMSRGPHSARPAAPVGWSQAVAALLRGDSDSLKHVCKRIQSCQYEKRQAAFFLSGRPLRRRL